MKKLKILLTLLTIALVAPTVSAQIHESKSFIKKTTITKDKDDNPWKKCQWFVRAGVLIPTGVSTNDNLLSPTAGFDLDLGFKLRMGRHGWYWGMDVAMFTAGVKGQDCYVNTAASYGGKHMTAIEGQTATQIGGRFNLTTFGWRARFSDFLLDINAGLAFSLESKTEFKNYPAVEIDNLMGNFEPHIGLGLAYKHLTLDMQFIPIPISHFDYRSHYYDAYGNYHDNGGQYHWENDSFYYSKFLLSIGYLF